MANPPSQAAPNPLSPIQWVAWAGINNRHPVDPDHKIQELAWGLQAAAEATRALAKLAAGEVEARDGVADKTPRGRPEVEARVQVVAPEVLARRPGHPLALRQECLVSHRQALIRALANPKMGNLWRPAKVPST